MEASAAGVANAAAVHLQGFQKQVGPYRTIEGELERALEGAGALSEEEDLSKVLDLLSS